jgi:hypothetical protein
VAGPYSARASSGCRWMPVLIDGRGRVDAGKPLDRLAAGRQNTFVPSGRPLLERRESQNAIRPEGVRDGPSIPED